MTDMQEQKLSPEDIGQLQFIDLQAQLHQSHLREAQLRWRLCIEELRKKYKAFDWEFRPETMSFVRPPDSVKSETPVASEPSE